MYFRNYRLWKTWLDHPLKSALSEHALTVNMWKHPNCLRNLDESPFIIFFSQFSRKLIWNVSPLALGEVLGRFVNTLSADGNYHVHGCENLQFPVEMQLSEKRKPFSEVFFLFLDSTSNSEHFERKDDRHSLCISEITDCENLCSNTVSRAPFQNRLG